MPAAAQVDPASPLEPRTRAFCQARAKELEATAQVRRASTRFESGSPVVAEAFAAVARMRRRAAARAFARELGDRAEALDLLDVATSARAWDAMRRDQKLAPTVAAKRMEKLVRAILKDR